MWSRLHTRQALVLGLLASMAYVAVLALPLVAIIAIANLPANATIAVYGVGLAVDVIAFVGLIALGLRCAARAARGELFAIPLVTRIVDRFLRPERF